MKLHIRVNSEYIIMLCCKGLRCRIKNQIHQWYELHSQCEDQGMQIYAYLLLYLLVDQFFLQQEKFIVTLISGWWVPFTLGHLTFKNN